MGLSIHCFGLKFGASFRIPLLSILVDINFDGVIAEYKHFVSCSGLKNNKTIISSSYIHQLLSLENSTAKLTTNSFVCLQI
jgi:hypothetical protein